MNIQDGQGFGLAQAIRAVEREFFVVMLLTKTKIQSEAYSHNPIGYGVNVLAAHTSSAGGAQGGVRMAMRARPVGWGIRATTGQTW